jgi:hypothetical protein
MIHGGTVRCMFRLNSIWPSEYSSDSYTKYYEGHNHTYYRHSPGTASKLRVRRLLGGRVTGSYYLHQRRP